MKNGFTLIELLAVLIILSIIALIATVSVGSVISTSKDELSEIQQNNVEEAAKAYYLKEGMSIDDQCISIQELVDKGYIEGTEVKDPKTGSVMTGFVKITYEANQYSYKYQENTCNITAVTTSKTGEVPKTDQYGNIVVGSEFKIKVSDNIKDENGKIKEYTFFVLSNSEDGDYVNLISEQNIDPQGKFTSEPQPGDEWYKTSADNGYGPQTAYDYLSKATNNWTNIPIIEDFEYYDEGNESDASYGYESIITAKNEKTGDYFTHINSSPSYANLAKYENMRARLPKYSEVTSTGCSSISGSCPLWMVNYLYSDSASDQYYNSTNGKENSTGNNHGYWTLSSYPGFDNDHVRLVIYDGYVLNSYPNIADYGVRPVITVLKSDLLRAISKN